MNPLTQVKNTQKITAREQAIGISEEGSWHAKFKNSAYVYVGGLPFDLTEGDILAVFSQYGEVVDVNLVRDQGTGKSKGFAFLAYEDQRSTVLAVDNLNGARVIGRIIKVDHVGDYKRKLEEDEEEKQRKREERGVCYAFQRGECNRGAACKFSHDEQRNANTGWGEGGAGWKHDKFDGSMKDAGRRISMVSTKGRDNGKNEKEASSRGRESSPNREVPGDRQVEERRIRGPERNGRDNDRVMKPPHDTQARNDHRRVERDSDRRDRRDGENRGGRRDGRGVEDRGRNEERRGDHEQGDRENDRRSQRDDGRNERRDERRERGSDNRSKR